MFAFLAPLLLRLGLKGGTGSFRLISIRLLFGILFGGFVVSLLWGWRVNQQRAKWQRTATEITMVVHEIAGMDAKHPLKPEDAAAKVRSIGQDRDIARRERDSATKALTVQTRSVRAYEAETKRNREVSDRNVKLVATLVRQRDVWIERARAASTRTERQSCQSELKEVEGILDGLYQNGF